VKLVDESVREDEYAKPNGVLGDDSASGVEI